MDWLQAIMWFIYLTAITLVIVAVLYVFFLMREEHLDKHTRRFVLATRYQPGATGNYPYYFDPKTGDYFHVAPGNNIPLAENVIIGNSPFQPIARERKDVPMIVYNNGKPQTPQSFAIGDVVQSERLFEPDEPERLANVPEERSIQDELARARGEGKPKAESIWRFAGIKKGGSPAYKIWSDFWDSL